MATIQEITEEATSKYADLGWIKIRNEEYPGRRTWQLEVDQARLLHLPQVLTRPRARAGPRGGRPPNELPHRRQ